MVRLIAVQGAVVVSEARVKLCSNFKTQLGNFLRISFHNHQDLVEVKLPNHSQEC